MSINLLWLGAAGMGSTVVSIAHRQNFFQKHGVNIQLVPVTGTQIPELTDDTPFGFIGAPASLMRAGEGADLNLLASLDTARLSVCLVTSPDISNADQLRGKRLGARVTGAAMWIHTVLALEKLGLDLGKDNISIAEIGDPTDVVRALEAGEIDGAVLSRAICEQLATKDFNILLDLFPLEVYGAPDALVAAKGFVADHPEVAEGIVAGLIEGIAFILSPRERKAALNGLRETLNITDDAAAESGLAELSDVLSRKPYPSLERLKDMQRIMLPARPNVGGVSIEEVLDDQFVRKLDENGFIDRTYAEYGVE
jgi:ABC-type nitrate/sulfonate/bicarbonate transport system substrate-binding protein